MIRRGRNRIITMKILFILVALFFGMGIGYAAISTTLTIEGTTDIDHSSWDIHFENIQVDSGSVTADTPTITDDTSVTFSASLANPGDYYEFTVDVVNDGTMNAKLDDISILPTLTSAESNYFDYTVTYVDGLPIQIDDTLKSGDYETLIVRFEYLRQSDTSLYPTADVDFDFSVSMSYVQSNSGNPVRLISVSDTVLSIGNAIPSTVTTYNHYQEAVTAFGHSFFNRHVTDSSTGLINRSDVGFVYNNKVYYLRGAGATKTGNTYNQDSIYYDDNVETLKEAFGETNCLVVGTIYRCTVSSYSATANKYGQVNVTLSGYVCEISPDGQSFCMYQD